MGKLGSDKHDEKTGGVTNRVRKPGGDKQGEKTGGSNRGTKAGGNI